MILARGLGSRMREAHESELSPVQAAAAATGAKAMMPMGANDSGEGRPFLDYVLSGLADARYTSACLVLGPEHIEARRYYTTIGRPRRIEVRFVEQTIPRGTADAVAAAADYIGDADALVINGDNYYPAAALSALRALRGAGVVLFRAGPLIARSNIPAERVNAFAIAHLDSNGRLARIVEKPEPEELAAAGPAALVSMNCWRMPPVIVDACRAIDLSPRGELELTRAVAYAIDTLGVRFEAIVSDEPVLDLSRRDDVRAVALRLSGITANP